MSSAGHRSPTPEAGPLPNVSLVAEAGRSWVQQSVIANGWPLCRECWPEMMDRVG